VKELTILLPCLNEAKTIGKCIERAQKLLSDNRIDGEILVSDNGSTDGSQDISRNLGAKVVSCPVRGYGVALQFGIERAAGAFILMGDADDSYHFDEALPMIEKLREGYDICMGTRLKGKIMDSAMPFLNRYLGTPVITVLGRIFFQIRLSDYNCGLRAFRKSTILGLNLVTTGMEWASEMIIKAKLEGLRMTEVPVTLFKDGRNRPPHLRRWRDGWRHIRFMLLHSPKWLFIIPGIMMIVTGFLGEVFLLRGMFKIGKVNFDVHTLLVMAFILILGVQVVFTGIFAKLYTYITGILPFDEKFDRKVKRLTLEKLLVLCIIIGSVGLGGFLFTLWQWYKVNFSALNYQVTMRQLIPSLTLLAVSVQGMFNGFMLSILFLKTNRVKSLVKEINYCFVRHYLSK
jgi:glycosyltransferase involved in cell wall biosynthesis